MNRFVSFILILLAAISVSLTIPEGWFIAGSKPKSYEMGSVPTGGRNGSTAATIRSVDTDIKGFGTLMQNSDPGIYSGKRVRLTGYIKSDKVAGWAGLWLRVDSKDDKTKSLSFDNMSDRPIKGTEDWVFCSIVLDVPSSAGNLAYGALLSGTGQIWFDDLKLEIVPDTTPLTGAAGTTTVPRNLDFEK